MSENTALENQTLTDLLSITLTKDWAVTFHVTPLPLLLIASLALGIWLILRYLTVRHVADFEIDGAELGFGKHKISFRPNDTDRQIAYSIWVELSTRKVGLPIDIEDDVIAEIYDSWYAFFDVTRELVKDIPISKVRNDSTGKIVELSVEVLNEGLRPHLTKWQARFRHWYKAQLDNKSDVDPQQLQKKFPEYEALSDDLLAVNRRLIAYRKKMNELVRG